VASVVSQTLLPNEIMLVDDGSGDRTLAKLYELQARYESTVRIDVVPLKKNLGVGPARNVGWDSATQPYIAFLDADDAWHPQKLEIQYKWMTNNPGIVLCGHDMKRVNHTYRSTAIAGSWAVFEVTWFKLLLSNVLPMSSVMIRRTIPFRFESVYLPDQLLWFRIVFAEYRAYMLQLPLSYMYKPPYGHSGASANLWNMEKAELENYKIIRKDNLISAALFRALLAYSLAKHIRRIMITSCNRYSGGHDD
jgi:glycosyltransferase involved in cell wall biosynthesis